MFNWKTKETNSLQGHRAECVLECSIGKQKKPILFKVTEPSSIPYRAPPACAKRALYPDPPPVILLPESIAAQAAYQLRYTRTLSIIPEYYSWVSSGPKCFQVLALPKPATESHVVNLIWIPTLRHGSVKWKSQAVQGYREVLCL